jgi:hypothetical protein
MMLQRRGRRSKAKIFDVSAMKLVEFLVPWGCLPFSSDFGLQRQFSYYWFWLFGVIETSYAETTIHVLGPIYLILSCYATILCDGCVVLLYCLDVFTVAVIFGILWSLALHNVIQMMFLLMMCLHLPDHS